MLYLIAFHWLCGHRVRLIGFVNHSSAPRYCCGTHVQPGRWDIFVFPDGDHQHDDERGVDSLYDRWEHAVGDRGNCVQRAYHG
jgi:hypothetical protein